MMPYMEDWYDDDEDTYARYAEDDDRDEDYNWECAFPGNCCMAHTDHMRDECYTPEMAEEYMSR